MDEWRKKFIDFPPSTWNVPKSRNATASDGHGQCITLKKVESFGTVSHIDIACASVSFVGGRKQVLCKQRRSFALAINLIAHSPHRNTHTHEGKRGKKSMPHRVAGDMWELGKRRRRNSSTRAFKYAYRHSRDNDDTIITHLREQVDYFSPPSSRQSLIDTDVVPNTITRVPSNHSAFRSFALLVTILPERCYHLQNRPATGGNRMRGGRENWQQLLFPLTPPRQLSSNLFPRQFSLPRHSAKKGGPAVSQRFGFFLRIHRHRPREDNELFPKSGR